MKIGEGTLRRRLEPLAVHLAHPGTTEIVVNRPGEIGVEQDGEWRWHAVPELNYRAIESIALLSAWMRSKELDEHRPICKSVLPGGERITVCRPPAVPDGTIGLTIRKRAVSFVPTLEWLAERGYFDYLPQDRDWPAYFARAIADQRTILICGSIGSSKTTFGESLLRAIPLDRRIVSIEDTPEWIRLPHKNWIPMYFGDNGRTALDCLDAARRMRPDWIPLQEMMGGEAWAYLQAIKIGHPGITTVHASNCEVSFAVLEDYIRQHEAGRSMPPGAIAEQLRRHIHIVVHCARDPYRLTEVMEVRP